ncbi:MAG: ATP-dependent DNA ligase [Candidatus Bathyarchaeota archaeon]|nr:ATP-dependent DNA ligase [Candidatus Bathyarchaeota archaeon]
MLFKALVEHFEKLEATTSRLAMIDILVHLFSETPPNLMDKVVYLTLGEVYPSYVGLEVGLADKLVLRAVVLATGIPDLKVEQEYKALGDSGLVAEKLLSTKRKATLFSQPLTVEKVYITLEKMCRISGEGAQDTKIKLFAGLLTDSTPKEAKYLSRIVSGRLRLGVAEMTILDALAVAYGGSRELRDTIERAYNITSDIGLIAKTLAEGGIDAVKNIKVAIGRPIKPQLAERLSSLDEILEKLNGRCIAEYKYDGLRIQAHIADGAVILFSRRQENITEQFPDIVEALKKCVVANEAILDGEAVPVDPNTGELLPFQVVAQRRRKYDIERYAEEIPVTLFLFDILYLDGEDLTVKPYLERKKLLESVIKETDRVKLAQYIVSGNPEEIERFFHKSIEEGTEGLICKSILPNSIYEAGKRGWQWIKWKRSYRSEMTDTVDLVAVGAFAGRGKRAGTYGALLMAAYNSDKDRFETVCKLGSGFTDEDLAKLPEMFKPYLINHKHPRVESSIEADYWFVPVIVAEVIGDEITLSPMHTCGFEAIRPKSGLAIRFPRLVRFREDKSAEDATTTTEIIEMYRMQLKTIEETTPTDTA